MVKRSVDSGQLDPAEIGRRARGLVLVLTDCDGVLTDGGVYYSAVGEELKRFSLRDGMGVERLREAGIETAIVTREVSPIVERRGEKLGITVYGGVRDKATMVRRLSDERRLSAEALAVIGDDVNDLPLIQAIAEVGLTAAPADAEPAVAAAVHHRCERRGGHGAFREFAEWLLAHRRGLAQEPRSIDRNL